MPIGGRRNTAMIRLTRELTPAAVRDHPSTGSANAKRPTENRRHCRTCRTSRTCRTIAPSARIRRLHARQRAANARLPPSPPFCEAIWMRPAFCEESERGSVLFVLDPPSSALQITARQAERTTNKCRQTPNDKAKIINAADLRARGAWGSGSSSPCGPNSTSRARNRADRS